MFNAFFFLDDSLLDISEEGLIKIPQVEIALVHTNQGGRWCLLRGYGCIRAVERVFPPVVMSALKSLVFTSRDVQH